jgi:uncharacterized protein
MPPGQQGEWVENGKQYYLTDRNPDPNWKNQTLVWSFDKMLITGPVCEPLKVAERAWE